MLQSEVMTTPLLFAGFHFVYHYDGLIIRWNRGCVQSVAANADPGGVNSELSERDASPGVRVCVKRFRDRA